MCGGAGDLGMLEEAWRVCCAVSSTHPQLCPDMPLPAPEPVWAAQACCLAGTHFIVSPETMILPISEPLLELLQNKSHLLATWGHGYPGSSNAGKPETQQAKKKKKEILLERL